MEDLEALFDAETIERKVEELAGRISADYAGKDLVMVCILKAATLFAADLARSLTIPARIAFVCASSYGSSSVAATEVAIRKDLELDIENQHVLIVDTIADSGKTLATLIDRYTRRGPASLKTAVLLDKPARRTRNVPLDYVGFEIPDLFVVGYGMDYSEQYRNLPYIASIAHP